VDIRHNQEKQISLFDKENIAYQKEYEYVINSSYQRMPIQNPSIQTYIAFENKEENGLGIPLPQGLFRCFALHHEEEQFVGENRIEHTPKNETVRFFLGKAFDIVGETVLERENHQNEELTYKSVIRNHKDEDVAVQVHFSCPYSRYRNGQALKLVRSSETAIHKDARSFYFLVEVPANGEKQIHFTIH